MTGPKTGARRVVTIVGTLLCAAGTGYFMQNVLIGSEPEQGSVQVAAITPVQDVVPMQDTVTDALVADGPLALVAPALPEAVAPSLIPAPVLEPSPDLAMPEPPMMAPQPGQLPDLPIELAALDDQPITPVPREEPSPRFGCEIKLHAVGVEAAMVDLALDAACKPNAQFTVHHSGMMFSAVTDADGLSGLTVPALSEEAMFIVSFASGGSALTSVQVENFGDYDRAVVQWNGPTGLQIHALEYDATYDEPGHIWEGAAHDLSRAIAGEGGFLTLLGDPALFTPHLAQVYTFPSGTAARAGIIDLSLEAVVTEDTCGRDVEAQVLQKTGEDSMIARDLSLAMPDCDAVGDFLVLKNMFDNLNIASN